MTRPIMQPVLPKLAIMLAFILPHTAKSERWLRLDSSLHHIKIDPQGKFIAFLKNRKSLSILNLKSKKIYAATSESGIDPSFFWSPYGKRLFFRQNRQKLKGQNYVSIQAYDCHIRKTVHIGNHNNTSGYLTYNPRNQTFHMLDRKGKLETRKLVFGKNRLADWTRFGNNNQGFWIATPNGILWATHGGLEVVKVTSNYRHIEAFAISPDGSSIAWNDETGVLYTSEQGQKPQRIGMGRDPAWHPTKSWLIYAGARLSGRKITGYDLRVTNLKTPGKWLTHTQHSDERYPNWYPGSRKIIYTKMRTTDLYWLRIKKKFKF